MKVLVICPDPKDGTAWWRVVSPLSVLREQAPGVFDFDVVNFADHTDVSRYDLLLLQRPCRAEDAAAMKWAKILGIPVVVDYDDDYTAIPKHNMMYPVYSAPSVQEVIKGFIRDADLLTVSTVELKMKWLQLNRRIAVVPNGFDDRFVLRRGEERLPYRRIMWRGGQSHVDDMARFADSFIRAAHEGAPAVWSFCGMSMHHLHPKMPHASIEEYEWQGVLEWFELLGKLQPSILVVPLADSPFNRAKSNISILEGAWAGAAVLAPDWDDWRAPGVTNYDGPKDFAKKLIALTKKSSKELRAMSNETWDAVRERLLVSRSNKLRVMLFSKLVEESKRSRIPALSTAPDKLDEIAKEAFNPTAPSEQKEPVPT